MRPNDFDIPENDPFKNDLLDRSKIAAALTKVISISTNGLVVSLNAPWGYGKTTFLKMWAASLRNANFRVVYFSAWESDFTDDPLVALLAELKSYSKTLKSAPLEQAVESVIRIGGQLAKAAAPLLARVATAGLVDLNGVSEEWSGDAAGRLLESEIKAYEESKRSMTSFHEAIADLASTSSGGLPLVFIIDELDRCRPNYSIKVIECIKHLFSVRGVVFLLALDRTQFASSIEKQYGTNIDSSGYLRRFFDLELSLPRAPLDQFLSAQFERFDLSSVLSKNREMLGVFYEDRLRKSVRECAEFFSCSYRDIDRVFSLLFLVVRTTAEGRVVHPYLMSFLIYLKTTEVGLFEEIKASRIDPEKIIAESIGRRRSGGFWSTEMGESIRALLLISMGTSKSLRGIGESLNRNAGMCGDDKLREIKLSAAGIADSPEGWRAAGSMKTAIEQIDLSAKLLDNS